jgi:hypothetical protein
MRNSLKTADVICCAPGHRNVELEQALNQAVATAHDAQTSALTLAGERNALQMQLAVVSNEAAVVRRVAEVAGQQADAASEKRLAQAEREFELIRSMLVSVISGSAISNGVRPAPNGYLISHIQS